MCQMCHEFGSSYGMFLFPLFFLILFCVMMFFMFRWRRQGCCFSPWRGDTNARMTEPEVAEEIGRLKK
jgi:uncharacterized membrane protein